MSSRRKDLAPPLTSSSLREHLASRYRDGSRTDATGATTGGQEKEDGPRRRSWYMSAASAESLTRLVDDLHHATRKPKHQVLAAVIEEALERQESIAGRLAEK